MRLQSNPAFAGVCMLVCLRESCAQGRDVFSLALRVRLSCSLALRGRLSCVHCGIAWCWDACAAAAGTEVSLRGYTATTRRLHGGRHMHAVTRRETDCTARDRVYGVRPIIRSETDFTAERPDVHERYAPEGEVPPYYRTRSPRPCLERSRGSVLGAVLLSRLNRKDALPHAQIHAYNNTHTRT